MRRSQVLNLVGAVSAMMPGGRLIVVGSQSVHGQVPTAPQVALASIETDLLLYPHFNLHDAIEEQFGLESDYLREHGVYAHPLGIGLVTLPKGWEDRLVPVKNDGGDVCYWALEIHDTAASKLMAGRDKDFEFIIELCYASEFRFESFLERVLLLRETAHGNAVLPRLIKLAERLRAARMNEQLSRTNEVITQLKSA
jgi:hypothetical protein